MSQFPVTGRFTSRDDHAAPVDGAREQTVARQGGQYDLEEVAAQ